MNREKDCTLILFPMCGSFEMSCFRVWQGQELKFQMKGTWDMLKKNWFMDFIHPVFIVFLWCENEIRIIWNSRLFYRCSARKRGKSGQHRASCFLTGRHPRGCRKCNREKPPRSCGARVKRRGKSPPGLQVTVVAVHLTSCKAMYIGDVGLPDQCRGVGR